MFEDLTSEEKSRFVGWMLVGCSVIIAYRLGKAAGSIETTKLILEKASGISSIAQIPVVGTIR